MILSNIEAAQALKYNSPDEMPGNVTSIILPAIDAYINNATGKDWSKDNPVDPIAKISANILLVRWFDDPAQIGAELKPTDPLIGIIGQLHAKVLQEEAV